MADIIREIEGIAASAWADREADEVLNAIQEALASKYRWRFPDLTALEIFYEDIEIFCLPYSDNAIIVIPSRVTTGVGSRTLCENNLDAFLKTSQGVTILQSVESEEGRE